MRGSPTKRFLIAVLLAGWSWTPMLAQPANGAGKLTAEEVVKLSQSGFSEDLIITKVRKNGKAFDLSTEELLELKKAGVSDNVIKYLLDPSQPYAPAAAPVTAPAPTGLAPSASSNTPAKEYPEDEFAARVPWEPGLYRFQPVPIRIDIRILLGTKEGGGLGKYLMKKGKVIAYLAGSASRTRITGPMAAFHMRLPEGKAIEEVLLVALDRKNNRREIDMGPPGPKPEFKAEVIRQFDTLEVGPRLFKLTTGKLKPGEYLFFLIGSAEPPKGSLGKGYDFGIEDPQGPHARI